MRFTQNNCFSLEFRPKSYFFFFRQIKFEISKISFQVLYCLFDAQYASRMWCIWELAIYLKLMKTILKKIQIISLIKASISHQIYLFVPEFRPKSWFRIRLREKPKVEFISISKNTLAILSVMSASAINTIAYLTYMLKEIFIWTRKKIKFWYQNIKKSH